MMGKAKKDPGDLPELSLRPIGVVKNSVRDPRPNGWEAIDSRIIIKKELVASLLGLNGYSHLIVLFWMHLIPLSMRGSELQIRSGVLSELSLQGILATRSQLRPNPIGLTVVPVIDVVGSVVYVRGLDAVNGTPVLDIKPYIPAFDSEASARIPDWARGS